MKGYTVVADFGQNQLLEKNNRRFAKIFLISDVANQNRWSVEPNSIPQRMGTFKEKPFISEPGLAHFNAENMSVDQILSEQEQYSIGTIRDVVRTRDNQAYAVVEFFSEIFKPKGDADTIRKKIAAANRVWSEMKNGKAIYASPAITGYARYVGNQKIFYDWVGLHLARVQDPAFGVFHASVKETCEGPEGICLSKLVASAAILLDETSSQLGESANEESIMEDMTEEEKKRKKHEDEMAAIKAELASIKEQLKTNTAAQIQGSEGQSSTDTSGQGLPESETQKGNAGDEVKMPKGTAKTVTMTQADYDKMKSAVASLEADKRNQLIDKIVDLHATAGMVSDETETAEREELNKKTTEQLSELAATAEKYVGRIMEVAQSKGLDIGGDQSSPSRLVKMPANPQTGTASKSESGLPRRLEDLKSGKWY